MSLHIFLLSAAQDRRRPDRDAEQHVRTSGAVRSSDQVLFGHQVCGHWTARGLETRGNSIRRD
jgi:hypothetical protein